MRGCKNNPGQSVPIPRDSQIRAKSAHMVTLETEMNAPSRYYLPINV